jgi:hypothetical protein
MALMKSSTKEKPARVKQTNLETMNAMFKDAFLVKKNLFAKTNPKLKDEELNKLTADYFRRLKNDNLRGDD